MEEFKGAFAASITPFTLEGELNEAVFRQILEFDIQAGIDGFWIGGSTGEGVSLTGSEVVRLAELAAEVCKGRAKTIVHVGSLTTESAVRKAKGARNAGADAICCVPPFFYRPSDQGIVDHYQAVADATDLPFFIYNTPKYTHIEFTAPMMEKMIQAIPQLVGLKHGGEFNNIRHFADMRLLVFTGSGALFLPALTAGAIGVIDGPLTFAPEIWVGIHKSYREGDLAQAQDLQHKASRLIALVAQYGTQASCKALTGARLGIGCGVPRKPISPLSNEQWEELMVKADEIGVLKTPQPSV